jgi:hypothetical protein
MSIARHHAEWLNLVPNSGPFVSLPVLTQVFPQGLHAHDAAHAHRLRLAFEEWEENQSGARPDPAIHRVWINLVLAETLGFEELLAQGQAIPQTLKTTIAEYGETLRPDWVVRDPGREKARLLIQAYPRGQSLDRPVQDSRWKVSPDTRMMQLLHDTGIRLGLVTNGEHWMLVNAPQHETTGSASWYAPLWFEEPLTLRAFRTLLAADRFFGVPDDETLEALLDRSTADQQDVTDQLGYQVRKAVEVLIQALDQADQDHGRTLLASVRQKELYEAALTVMMRLVFLFCAEERDLLLLGDDVYDQNYAVSTLREQLRTAADQYGEEILGLRFDAWPRLLTTFRAVYGGVTHDRLKLPAYGGSLFNPDRFAFLEGRTSGTSWRDTGSTPLPVNNRTVLHLLKALQVLQVRFPGGGAPEARRLSFRSLDIEQIGHVYEGLLDHTAKRAVEPMLGLAGTRDQEPEIALSTLEQMAGQGEKALLKFLKEATGRSESALKKDLHAEIDVQLASRFRTACQGNETLWKRVEPFAGVVRLDTVDYPVVIPTGSVYVTAGDDRRSSGTHYTPRSLTEPLVQYTLEPLVYTGPAEGLSREQWMLRPARQLLDLKICDMACGSGAFLVQACRYLAARLLEAWNEVQRTNPGAVWMTPEGQPSTGQPGEALVPEDPGERQTAALRLVAQRCLYGVDKNRLAVEMAKLSLWLLTLAKGKPFEFLDHAICCGDSLVGIHDLEQLRKFSLDAMGENDPLFVHFLDQQVQEAVERRRQIIAMQANSVEDVRRQEEWLKEFEEQTEKLQSVADLLLGAELLSWDQHYLIQEALEDEEAADEEGQRSAPVWLHAKKATERFRRAARAQAAMEVAGHFHQSSLEEFQVLAATWLNGRQTFHWPLAFPEVLVERGGFDAFVGNPPFMGGQKITGNLGDEYREFLVNHLAHGQRGSADLCAYFFLRAHQLLRDQGQMGLLATNTIAQGDTRQVGLEQLARNGCTIPRAVSSRKWPGTANLEVAHVWVHQGRWQGDFFLDEQPTQGITSFLTPPGSVTSPPYRLKANEDKSFQGSIVLGMGFVLAPEEAQQLIAKDPRNKNVLFPYLNGEDLNSRPDQSPSRWVINFFDWPLEQESAPEGYTGAVAADYPDCLAIIEAKVKPERMKLKDNNDGLRRKRYWWQYGRVTPALNHTIAGLERVLVVSLVTHHVGFGFVPANQVFAHKLAVFPLNTWSSFALLQSNFHEPWARHYWVEPNKGTKSFIDRRTSAPWVPTGRSPWHG